MTETTYLRFFLPDGFSLTSPGPQDTAAVLAAIGDRMRPSNVQFTAPFGTKIDNVYELTADVQVRIGNRSYFYNAGNLMAVASVPAVSASTGNLHYAPTSGKQNESKHATTTH